MKKSALSVEVVIPTHIELHTVCPYCYEHNMTEIEDDDNAYGLRDIDCEYCHKEYEAVW
jgi:formate dehydrogenase maturation protein FdhE